MPTMWLFKMLNQIKRKIMIKVDKNVPIPNGGLDGRMKYPTATMEVGESFVLKNKLSYGQHLASMNNKRFGGEKRFRAALDPKGKVRVWRVK